MKNRFGFMPSHSIRFGIDLFDRKEEKKRSG